MKLSACIDWLTLSGDLGLADQLGNTKFKFSVGSKLSGIARYPTGYKLSPVGTLFISDSEGQGSLFTLSGQDMQVLRDRSGDDGITLAELLPISSPTRLDFAFDIHEDVSLDLLQGQVRRGQHITKFKTSPIVIQGLSEQGGHTIYFGSPKSDRRVRIYDKASQMKILNEAWFRVELQVRRKRAKSIAVDMLRLGWEQVGIASIKECLDFPSCKWWSDAFKCGDIQLSQIPRKAPAWQLWMEVQVKSSIIAHYKNVSDRFFIDEWLESTKEAL